MSNVEAKALFNTLAKTVKYKKAETHNTTLGHVAAEGISLLDTVSDTLQKVMADTLIDILGDVEGDSLVDTVADT